LTHWAKGAKLFFKKQESESIVKIAGIQIQGTVEKQKNLEKAQRMARIAAERGAKMICFPELFQTPWFPMDIRPENFSLAEEVPGPTTALMQQLAKEMEAVFILPLFEKDPRGRYFNTAAVVDADGRLVGKYRKIHVPQIPLWEEKAYFQPGDLGFPIFDTRFGRVGIQICWDNFFPEGARILALKGAQAIFAPTAAAFASQEKWEKVICASAAMNGVFILRVNRVGKEPKQHFYGRSFCASPEGELIDPPSGAQEGVVLTEIDLSEIERTRRVWTFMRDRRPEVYGEMLRKEEKVPTTEHAEGTEKI
jgi:N-carbamoylputrescine amidase